MHRLTPVLVVPLAVLFAACGPLPNNPNGGGPGGCSTLKAASVANGGHVTAGCYKVDGTIDVAQNTLTLDPGVTLEFPNNASFILEAGAILNAAGTRARPIVLTGQSQTRGYWMGLGYQGSKSNRNVLSNVTLEYAGSGPWTGDANSVTALFVGDQSQMEMDHSTIQHNDGSGFDVYNSATIDFHDDTVTDNPIPGLAGPQAIDGIAASNTLTGNTHDDLEVSDVDLKRDTTWHALDVPILQPATSWTDIQNNATLTLEAGVTVAFGAGAHLNVDSTGTLKSMGTQAKPVTLTGKEKTPGFWKGVRVNHLATMDHTIVEYAGSKAFTGAASTVADVFLDNFLGTGSLTANGLTLRDSAGFGLYVESGATVSGCGTITFSSDGTGNVGGTKAGTDCP